MGKPKVDKYAVLVAALDRAERRMRAAFTAWDKARAALLRADKRLDARLGQRIGGREDARDLYPPDGCMEPPPVAPADWSEAQALFDSLAAGESLADALDSQARRVRQ